MSLRRRTDKQARPAAEAHLRKFPSLRPRAYAEEMQALIERAFRDDQDDPLDEEILSISARSGVSVDSALSDLVKAGVIFRFGTSKIAGDGGSGT